MIIESRVLKTVGDTVRLALFQRGPNSFTQAKIVRAATEQEYVDDCLADPGFPEESRHLTVVTNAPNLYWYEVSTD